MKRLLRTMYDLMSILWMVVGILLIAAWIWAVGILLGR